MLPNREIRQMFSLYGELLVLHGKDGHMAALLSGAAYRMRKISDNVESMDKTALAKWFRPEVLKLIDEIKKRTPWKPLTNSFNSLRPVSSK